MQRHIMRGAFKAVTAAVACGAIPLLVLAWWLGTGSDQRRHDFIETVSTWEGSLARTAMILGSSALAIGVGCAVAWWHHKRMTDRLALLAANAERFGAGESRFLTVTTGVEELDRINTVLADSALRLTRNLAAERDFVADASHQLRTPLTALLMRLDEISASRDIGVIHEEAEVAIDQVERLSNVVADLMGRSRASNGTKPTVSLDSVLAQLQRDWQPQFAATRRSMWVHGERGIQVQTTPVALHQILSTLVENGLAHGHGTVDIAARRNGPSIVIELGDEGEGVAPNMAAHIFERSVSSQGSGLGLSLARDLAEDAGGRLELLTAQPARFAVFLPEAE